MIKSTGIQWNEGSLDYSELGLHLVKAISKATTLYTTSKAKAQTLEQLTGRGFISIEDFDPPKHNALKNMMGCLHPCHSIETMHCAMKNAHTAATYVRFVDGQHDFQNLLPSE